MNTNFAAGDPTRNLSPEERAFLAGTLFIKLLARDAAPGWMVVGPQDFLRARTRLARQDEVSAGEVAAVVRADPGELLAFLARFDAAAGTASRRQRIGTALLARSTAVALVGGGGTLAAAGLRHLADDVARPALARALGRQRRAGPAKAAPARAEAPAIDSPHAAGLRADVAEWLGLFGYEETGVRIDSYTVTIAGCIPAPALDEIDAVRRADGDLAALERLVETIRERRLGVNARTLLHRVVAVVRLGERGYRLPAKATAPAYEPEPGTVFYLLHMRDPYEVNGYVTRSRLVIAAMQAAGLRPVAITRLGFPADLVRHRNATVAGEDVLNGAPVLSLADPGGGLLGRPADEYIDAYADRIVELARRHRPAAIQAASNYMNGLAALRAARTLGIPCIYEVRGIWEMTQLSEDESYGLTRRYAMQRRLENQVVAAADRVMAISDQLRRFVVEHGAEPDRTLVVPNGVEADKIRRLPRDPALQARLGIPQDAVVIGYVGSIVYYEGLDSLLRAADILRRRGAPEFRLLIVGDGKALAALRRLADKLGIAGLCIFLGRVPHDEVEGLFSIIDISPVPRHSLPVTELVPPLKPFEAMAAGKAVVVSSVAAMAETVVDGETGLVVEKDNVGALADALERLLRDPQLRQRLGDAARERVDTTHSVAGIARVIGEVYRPLGVRDAAGA